MSCTVRVNNNQKYIAYLATSGRIATEQDALELVAACIEHGTGLLLLPADALAADFFRLRTGLAGQIMQKLANYHMKTALVLPAETTVTGRFKDLMAEMNSGNTFRIFAGESEAVNWLTQ